MTLPPLADRWEPATFAINRDAAEQSSACIGGIRWYVRNWRRGAGDTILCEMQPVSDAEFEALQADLKARMGA